MKVCTSCAATEADSATFPAKIRGESRHCQACADAFSQGGRVFVLSRDGVSIHAGPPRTRASYRAALRHRRASAQGDMVDQIVRAP